MSLRWCRNALVVASVTACGCSGSPDRVAPGRDVVLIVIDTLRADHVGVYGDAPHPATPEIDELARRGRWFTDTWASAPWTPPSVMSLLTSLEPPVHGLELEGHLLAETVPALPAGASTLAEILRSSGYRTLAVTAGGGVGSSFGFDRGFDRFYEPEGRPDMDVEAGVDRAIRWLAEERSRPLFFFFHTYEVHLPNTHEVFDGGDDPASRAVAAYASDLAVADRHLGRLFAALEASGRLSRSVIVVTSDHGENLHDRVLGGRPVEHGHHLHPELLRVPLIVVAPGLVPAGTPVDTPVRLLDVLPTVCSLLGVDLGRVPHQGRDLRPLLQGGEPPVATPAIFAWAPLPGPTWRAVRTPDWTLILSPPVSTDEWWGDVRVPPQGLYDRHADPGEVANVARDHPGILSAMTSTVNERREADLALREALGGGGALPSSSAEALRELGYLDRVPPSEE